MLCALISDIHANLEALTAVLKDAENRHVDEIYSLGDVIGYGSDPGPCLDLVEKTCTMKLYGNHEQAARGLLATGGYNAAAKESAAWTKRQLRDHHFDIMNRFTKDARIGRAYFVHASPHEPESWRYVLSGEEAELAFSAFTEHLCFNGHTHLPIIFSETRAGEPRLRIGHSFMPDPDTRYVINVGSVGQPRDNDTRACYVVLNTTELEVEYVRVPYDVRVTQEKMASADLPEALIQRLAVGR